MTKKEKIKSLQNAMERSERNDHTEYTYFTDNAPEELRQLFLEHYEVRDVDYMVFSDACDIVSDIYQNSPEITGREAEEAVYEDYSESASVYTATRLEYLNIWNQDEISEILKEGCEDIATACAIWYDRQVEQASITINQWINS